MIERVRRLAPLLGMNQQGDLGGVTVYRSQRKRVVVFLKAPPKKPPSQLQLTFRNLWRLYGTAWNDLTDEQRDNYRLAARKLRLRTSGAGLFYSFMRRRDAQERATYERLAGVTLHLPSYQIWS